MSRGKNVKMLEDEIAGIDRQIAELQIRRDTLVQLRAKMSGHVVEPKKRAVRSNVKTTVLDLLERVGANGLNATIAVDMAREEFGQNLDRGSVSSLLSRLKHDGTVIYDGKLYRLAEHARSASEHSASVYPLPRASGDMP